MKSGMLRAGGILAKLIHAKKSLVVKATSNLIYQN
jgi:hypothetical protein